MTADIPWLIGDADVLDVITARKRADSRPGDREDAHRVALVVEGGGMRGAYIGGMVKGLGQLGLASAFDEIFAVSAGAFSSTALLTGHVDTAVRVYAENLVDGDFVSWRRFLSRQGPLISLDFLIDEVMVHQLPLDFGSLSAIRPKLRPVATDLESLQAVAFDELQSADDWRAALRASATVPLVAGPPVEFRGRSYVDGFVADALPLAQAIAGGATHVLALVARAPGETLRTGHRTAPLTRSRFDSVAPGLAALMAERAVSYAASMALVIDPGHPGRGAASLLAIRPTHGCGVAALTTDKAKLWGAGRAGEDAVRLAMSIAARRHRDDDLPELRFVGR